MAEPRYRGESWAHSILRADLEAAAEAERQRAADAERARAAEREAVSAPPIPAPPAPTPERRTWRDLSPDELNRYALAESRQP